MESKVLIIGSGPAGYTAAIYAARACLEPILVSGHQKGGQLTITTDVENYPGFAEMIQGPWLVEQMEIQAKNVGTTVVNDSIVRVDFMHRPFRAYGEGGHTYTAKSVIICTGSQARWLNLPSEVKYRGFGVSGCATCDGFFYRGKKVMVVGGGNMAVEEALFLTNHAAEVLLVHRKDQLRAERVIQNRLLAHNKIKVMWNTVLVEVLGSQNPVCVTEAVLRNVKSDELIKVPIDGIFIAIGHIPNTEIFKDQLKLDADGYITTNPGSTATNIPGIFVAGDVQDKIFKQAITAAGSGCMAALEAEKFCMHQTF
ncbi:thioredoxin reductase [Alphaproteobacteria bacterium]